MRCSEPGLRVQVVCLALCIASSHCYPSLMQHTNPRSPLGPCLLSFSLLFVSVAAPSLAAELRAGFARIDITPTTPVMLAGYASRKELSQGVHDPLFARAVAFEQN